MAFSEVEAEFPFATASAAVEAKNQNKVFLFYYRLIFVASNDYISK